MQLQFRTHHSTAEAFKRSIFRQKKTKEQQKFKEGFISPEIFI